MMTFRKYLPTFVVTYRNSTGAIATAQYASQQHLNQAVIELERQRLIILRTEAR